MTSLLVLGGTSWLGGLTARHALRRGLEVTCLARGESGRAPDGATWVRADRRQPGAYDEVAGRSWDLVVDVGRQPAQVRSAVAALGTRAGHWVLVSTISVYADPVGPGSDETAPVLPAYTGDGEAGPGGLRAGQGGLRAGVPRGSGGGPPARGPRRAARRARRPQRPVRLLAGEGGAGGRRRVGAVPRDSRCR